MARFARHGLTPAVLIGVELGRFTAHGLTPAVLTVVELGRFARGLQAPRGKGEAAPEG